MHMAVSNTPASKTLTPTLIFSLLRLSADSLALAVSASQPLKSGTLSFYLSIHVPVLIPSVVISRPTTVSRHFNPRNPSPLAPQIRLLLTTVRVYKLYLLTYYECSRMKPRQHGALQILYSNFVLYCM